MKQRVIATGAAALSWMACAGMAAAQSPLRPDQPAVMTPPEAPAPAPRVDPTGPFRARYQAVGMPTVLLFWNVEFDDASASRSQQVDRTQSTITFRADERNSTTERVKETRNVDLAKRRSPLSEGAAAELESTFLSRLQSAGMRTKQRAMTVRMTAADSDRSEANPKLVEADAVAQKADVLLEVLMVPDTAAPLGSAFKVTATRVKEGTLIFNLYTTAQPQVSVPAGRYVATGSGFQWTQPTARSASTAEVAETLADEVLIQWLRVL